jgi:hypothetical protein
VHLFAKLIGKRDSNGTQGKQSSATSIDQQSEAAEDGHQKGGRGSFGAAGLHLRTSLVSPIKQQQQHHTSNRKGQHSCDSSVANGIVQWQQRHADKRGGQMRQLCKSFLLINLVSR